MLYPVHQTISMVPDLLATTSAMMPICNGAVLFFDGKKPPYFMAERFPAQSMDVEVTRPTIGPSGEIVKKMWPATVPGACATGLSSPAWQDSRPCPPPG